MTTTALDRLERVARRVGWSLRWESQRAKTHPTLTVTELHILDGQRPVTERRGVWSLHASKVDPDNGAAEARESIANRVLDALPRRGAAAT